MWGSGWLEHSIVTLTGVFLKLFHLNAAENKNNNSAQDFLQFQSNIQRQCSSQTSFRALDLHRHEIKFSFSVGIAWDVTWRTVFSTFTAANAWFELATPSCVFLVLWPETTPGNWCSDLERTGASLARLRITGMRLLKSLLSLDTNYTWSRIEHTNCRICGYRHAEITSKICLNNKYILKTGHRAITLLAFSAGISPGV